MNAIENVIRRKITLDLVIKPFDQDLLNSIEKSYMYLFLINFERDTKSNPNLWFCRRFLCTIDKMYPCLFHWSKYQDNPQGKRFLQICTFLKFTWLENYSKLFISISSSNLASQNKKIKYKSSRIFAFRLLAKFLLEFNYLKNWAALLRSQNFKKIRFQNLYPYWQVNFYP